MPNDRVYIHERIAINGLHRAEYMQHMTANWSPLAQEDRQQLCFGVWAVIGSTGPWPEVINLWEMPGWDGLADGFEIETAGRGGYDPALERWWAHAADLRRGGYDRIVVPAPWSPTITELTEQGAGGQCYAHDLVSVRPGSDVDVLEEVRAAYAPLTEEDGWRLIGAFRTALRNDDEVVLLWSIPSFRAWAQHERRQVPGTDIGRWRRSMDDRVTAWERVLLVDAPLGPLKTGRQPSRDDRTDWSD